MKKIIWTIASVLLLGASATAQTPLPYSTGFDTPAESAGWDFVSSDTITVFRWKIVADNPVSAPNKLYYQPCDLIYDTIADFYVSPPFDFSNGGTLSFQYIQTKDTGTIRPYENHLRVYLVDNKNVYNSTIYRDVTDFKNSVTLADYSWKNSGEINIPAQSGTSYLAFKYQRYSYYGASISIDNISISPWPLGIKEAPSTGPELKVYPNPATGIIRLENTGNIQGETTVNLYDIAGRLLLSEKINFGTAGAVYQLPVAQFPAGIYQLQIQAENGVHAQKIILE